MWADVGPPATQAVEALRALGRESPAELRFRTFRNGPTRTPTTSDRSRACGRSDAAGTVRVPLMTRYEYATVPLLVHATKQILDNWGDDGWELVTVIPGPNPENLVAYLKREKA